MVHCIQDTFFSKPDKEEANKISQKCDGDVSEVEIANRPYEMNEKLILLPTNNHVTAQK